MLLNQAKRLLSQQTQSLVERGDRVFVKTYARRPVALREGRGSMLIDVDGREYVDMSSGIAVNCLGHGDPEWQKALTEQSVRLAHSSNMYLHEPGVELAELLVEKSPAQFSRVFFTNSGTEANEAALKFAQRTLPDRSAIVAFKGGFHGRTYGSLAATYKPAIREPFLPLPFDVRFTDFNGQSVDDLRRIVDEDVRAVILEPIQGEGGVLPADVQFLRAVRQVCTEAGALMIVDEVQCGLGRTGNLFAHEEYSNVAPDIMTLAKPLAGGLPIGAVLTSDAAVRGVNYGDHGSTFAGNPLVCAVAKHTLSRIASDDFLAHVRARGAQAYGTLSAMRGVKAVRSSISKQSLLIGVDLHESVNVPALLTRAEELGALYITAGANTVRICPPLIITADELDRGLEVLSQCIQEQLKE